MHRHKKNPRPKWIGAGIYDRLARDSRLRIERPDYMGK